MIKQYIRTIEPLMRLIAMFFVAYFGFVIFGFVLIYSELFAEFMVNYLKN